MDLSVVIICRNDDAGLAKTLQSVAPLKAEVLVCDTGSTDQSVEVAKSYGARVVSMPWEGYGKNRWRAAQLVTHDWILMLDTDEMIDTNLCDAIQQIDTSETNVVYNIRYINHFGNKRIRFGEWKNDAHIRLGNRRGIKTDGETVHEKLFIHPTITIRPIEGYILHYTVKDLHHLVQKQTNYAFLAAGKYYRQQKRVFPLQGIISAQFSFLKNYVFRLGFLDGWRGLTLAMVMAWYTWLKYAALKDINDTKAPVPVKPRLEEESAISWSTQ